MRGRVDRAFAAKAGSVPCPRARTERRGDLRSPPLPCCTAGCSPRSADSCTPPGDGAAGADLRAVQQHRDPRSDGVGPDARWAVDAPLPDRPGAGGAAGSARSRQPLAGPRCHGSSWPRPRLHSRSCSTPILSTLDLVAMMIGGVHFAESCCVVAFGIDLQGIEHAAGIW